MPQYNDRNINRDTAPMPARLPQASRDRCFLVMNVADDRAYSALARLNSLAMLTDAFLSEGLRSRDLTPRLMATIAHRTAKLDKELRRENRQQRQRHENPNLANLRKLAAALEQSIEGLNSQGLTNTAWAYASVGVKDDALFRALSSAAQKKLGEFNSQDLANTAWAYATVGMKDEGLFRSLSAACQKRVGEFNSQGLANTAWAYATVGMKDEGLFRSLSAACQKKVREFNPQDLANTAWAYATVGMKDEGLFRALSAACQKKVGEFNSQNLANTAWAYATVGMKDEGLFRAVSAACQKKVGEFNSQNLANTAWAYATVGMKDEGLFRALSAACQKKVGEFNSQALANTAWAYATVGMKDEGLFRALSAACQKKVGEFNSQALANTAWALSFGAPELVTEVCNRENLTRFSDPNGWLQAYHALIVAGVVDPSESQPMLQRIEAGYTPEACNGFENSVYRWLTSELGIATHAITRQRAIAGIGTDLVIEDKGRKVIIECDGDRYHLTSGPDGGTPFGRDLIQDAVLEKYGYKVVHILSSEFDKADRQTLARRVRDAIGG